MRIFKTRLFTIEEKKIVRVLANEVLSYSNEQLNKLVKDNKLIGVNYDG